MTESEIMKALECCCDGKITRCIKECPLKDFDGECYSAMKRDILDLINRKNAENEDLQNQLSIFTKLLDKAEEKIEEKDAENERLAKEVDRLSQVVLYHDGQISDARAEAIKEFLDKAEKKIEAVFGEHHFYDGEVLFLLEQISKEMGCGE